MAIITFADHLAVVRHTFAMFRLMLPMLCTMAVTYFPWCVVTVVLMYRYGDYAAVMPMKTTKKEVKTDVYAGVPVNSAVVRAVVHISWCTPVNGRVTVPAPITINNATVVIRYIDNFRANRLNNDPTLNPRHFDLLKVG